MGGTPGYWYEGFLTLQRAVDISVGYYLMKLNVTTAPDSVDKNFVQVCLF